MSPLPSRRRRRRLSRSARRSIVGAVAAAVVAFLLIGGALRTGSQSTSYLRAVNHSYAEQVAVLAARSGATGHQLAALIPAMAGRSRAALEASLDTLVQQAESTARQASALESPAPSSGVGVDVAAAFEQRAVAVAAFRRTVDQVLVLSPLPLVAGIDPPATVAPTPPALSAGAAQAAFQRVGATIASSDRAYAAGRRALRAAPGHAVLPAAAWTRDRTALTPTGASSLVASLGASSTLAAIHDVELVTDALALTPSPVPPSSGAAVPAGTLEVPPTRKLAASVVVANPGNVPARRIVVGVSVASQSGSASPTRRSRTVSLAPGASTTVALPPAPVAPNGHYTVTVTVSPPVPNATAGTVTTDTLSVAVAPPSPPAVAQVTPPKGPARGGTVVVILGTNFGQATTVTFGTADARFTVVSGTEIKAVSPPGKGKVAVTVANAGGPSGYSAGNLFTYTSPHRKTGHPTTTTTSAAPPSSVPGG